MAHSLSAQKRVRQSAKRNARNRHRKLLLKNDVKGFTAAIVKGDVAAAGEAFKQVTSRLAKSAAKHTIHKNAAARRRSRAAKKLNKLTAGTKA
ncbi:30S ribosomal protein S20 [bacterium]|nr:MAG: 30S ribosomal protein S20 [bacterium]